MSLDCAGDKVALPKVLAVPEMLLLRCTYCAEPDLPPLSCARRLCLQSYHLMAIGMPEPVQQTSTVPSHTPGSAAIAQHQQDVGAGREQTAAQDSPDVFASAAVHPSEAAAVAPAKDAAGQQSEAAGVVELEQPALRTPAVADAGAARDTQVLAAHPAACSIGGATVGQSISSSSSQGGTVRMVLPQLPLPHLLHLELDGCR